MYRILQSTFRPAQIHTEPVVIRNEIGRFKDARGQCKSAFYSELEMLVEHNYFGTADHYVDEELYTVRLYDDSGSEAYSVVYWWEEYENDYVIRRC